MRRQFATLTTLALLVALASGAYGWMVSSQKASVIATENLQGCVRLSSHINNLRQKPLLAVSETQSATELAHLIETSAEKAKLLSANIVQIDPQPVRRLGDSAYKEQPTYIQLRDVTLKQLITLVHTLTNGESSTQLIELRLSSPRNEQTAAQEETWTVEMTLTHLIFGP